MSAGNSDMAGQHQLESATQTGAFHRGNIRFLRLVDRSKEPVSGDYQLLHLLKRTSQLRVVHLLQIGSRTEISFFQAHQYYAFNVGGLLGTPHDLLPLRHALPVENVDRLAEIIKTCQQDPLVKDCSLEVFVLAG